jgi:hypothetical protein
MKSLYIDPSYKCCGITMVDDVSREISFSRLLVEHDAMKSYELYFTNALLYKSELRATLCYMQPDRVYLEYPFFMGRTTGGLFGLSFLFASEIFSYFECFEPRQFFGDRLCLINPSFCKNNFKVLFPQFLAGAKQKVQHRSQAVKQLISNLKMDSFVFKDEEYLDETAAKEDVATSFLFWYLARPEIAEDLYRLKIANKKKKKKEYKKWINQIP